MSSNKVHNRRNAVLRRIADKAGHSTRTALRLDDMFSDVTYESGRQFVSQKNSVLAGDLNHLHERGLIKQHPFYNREANSLGENVLDEFGITITLAGIEGARQLERSWWSKAIEKQPITFLQVLIALAQIAWLIALALWTWWATAGFPRFWN